jgi:hypothetical protein
MKRFAIAPTRINTSIAACHSAVASPASSTAPADRVYHFVDLRFFTVDRGTGANKRATHGAMADA